MKRFIISMFAITVLFFSGKAQNVVMDFENIPDFSKDFSPWRAVDLDLQNTYGFTGIGFPTSTYPMAFICFNPAQTNPPMTTQDIQPHSGQKFGACFSATTPPNNDWFISPAVNLQNNADFSLWVQSYTMQYGGEKYRIGVSVTDSNPSSFTFITDTLKAPGQWTKVTVSLSAYAGKKVYVAVQCVSNDQFIFMIDDLVINTGSETPGELFEDFEEMSDFSKDLSPWNVADLNGGITYGIEDHTFPHMGEPMAWIVFNPLTVTPPMLTPAIQAHSGERYAACFASAPFHNPNDKWLISPRMRLGPNAKIGLWTETFNPEYGMEKYRICVSTKTMETEDFVVVSGLAPLEAPINWGYKTVDLSAYTDSLVYVAIQCVSDNTFLLMVDDIEIGSHVGIKEKSIQDEISVFPNPATDRISVDFAKPVSVLSVSLFDFTGKKILENMNFQKNENSMNLNLPALADGMYFIELSTGSGRIIKKILIKRN